MLGNSEAERTLHPSERVLTVMQTVQCDFFFCLKQNLFAERVKPYVRVCVLFVCVHSCTFVCVCVCEVHIRLKMLFFLQMSDSGEAVMVNLRERKRWRKYPCAVKSNHFVIYRDSKVRPPSVAHKMIYHVFLFTCSWTTSYHALLYTNLICSLGQCQMLKTLHQLGKNNNIAYRCGEFVLMN